MQGYIKLKETDEELYEVNFNVKNPKNKENIFIYIIYFIIQNYLKLVVKIKKCFHIITVKEIYYGLIFILPFSNQKNIEKQLKKCIPKLKKLMRKYGISTLVLSEDLQKNESFLTGFKNDNLLEKKVHILDGKEIMPYLIKEIIEYILQNKSTQLEDLYLLIKQDYSEYKENIAFLSQYFKTINIVTPCLKSYQKFANKLEKEHSTIITVTNNKRKSLRRAKWLVNFDMPIEEMKKYTIYQTSAIIYLGKDGVYKGNAFDGIHICKAGIDVSQEIKDFFINHNLFKQFSITILYESTLINKRFWSIKEQMKKNQLKIAKLYGSRGILTREELKKIG